MGFHESMANQAAPDNGWRQRRNGPAPGRKGKMVAPAILGAIRRAMFDEPVEAGHRLGSLARILGDFISFEVSPGHISHSFGGYMRLDSNPGTDVERRPQNTARHEPFQEVPVESQRIEKGHAVIAGVISFIIMSLDPPRHALQTAFDFFLHIRSGHFREPRQLSESTNWR